MIFIGVLLKVVIRFDRLSERRWKRCGARADLRRTRGNPEARRGNLVRFESHTEGTNEVHMQSSLGPWVTPVASHSESRKCLVSE